MGMPTCEIIPLGRTTKSMAEVDAFLRELSPRFTADTYNLLSHNCNHFSNELAHFLTGGTGGVPARIVNVADEALSAPQGQQLRMMLESMQANMAAAQLGNRFNPLAHVPPVAAAPTTAPTTAAAAAAAAAGAPIAPTTAPHTATPVAVATAPAGPPAATVDEPPLNLTPLREALVALDAVRDDARSAL
jgi:predicted component of type VI protein secretion system